MARKKYLSAISVAIILVAAIAISTGFVSVGIIAHGQGNITSGNVTLTPEQKDAICNPNNPASHLNPVNTTESKICGIPKNLKLHQHIVKYDNRKRSTTNCFSSLSYSSSGRIGLTN